MALEKELIQLRKSNRITQEQLAEQMNVSRQTIYKWERGEAVPGSEKLAQLAQFYQVSMERLMGGDDVQKITEEETVILTEQSADVNPLDDSQSRTSIHRLIAFCILCGVCLLCVFILGWKLATLHTSPVETVTAIEDLTEDEFDLSSARRFDLGE